ncbi:MAG: metallophosphoesterase family protein [Rubrivivax sp.]|nr:metallophosphoesterase family protein [Labilithrix sp.]MCW5613222.1 metallophosphoesterase family protein [Rubrivivax sp.]MCW5833681.1 metallophosphoesterase family protein [Labilithrix sp.]
MDWFPRPARVADVELVGPSEELDAEALFRLLTAADAREWPHKVGVAGRSEGSAKPTTRLLASRGIVFKTNLAEVSPSREAALARVERARELGARARVWHPSKRWALMRIGDGWLPLTACRELRTLRTIELLADRLRAWTAMLDLGLEVQRRCGLGLDLNPANFALEDGREDLHYLDDELYARLEPRQLAFAAAARIPEEPDAEEATWYGWGRDVGLALDRRGVSDEERDVVVGEALGYPLAETFEPRRAALVAGLRAERPTVRLGRRSFGRSERVCLLADVHANLPALEAVVAAARDLGATSFLFLGDAVGYGPHPAECVARLAELGGISIRGNHDHAIATGELDVGMNRLARTCAEWTRGRLGRAEVEWLDSLRPDHRDGEWMAVHGAPRDPKRFFAYVYDLTYEDNLDHMEREGVAVCFHGHTHVPLVHTELPSGRAKLTAPRHLTLDTRRPTLVNPGSVGQPRDGDPRAAFAVWDRATSRVSFERAAYDLARTLADIRREGLPVELLSRLERGA